jgi:hypothetical protein
LLLKEAFIAFHKDEIKTKKYMNIYRIGKLNEFDDEASLKISENKQSEIKNDFDKLRKLAIEMVCHFIKKL